MTLILTNSVTKMQYNFTVSDASDSRLFYHINDFRLYNDMDEGQYNYSLLDDDNEVASGILQIGEYENNSTTYTTTDGNYKQYNG